MIAQAVGQSGVDKFVNAFGSGIALGAIYALLALGFVIIFKATQVVNFAQGAIAALGAYLVSYFAVTINIPGRWITAAPDWLQWSSEIAEKLSAAWEPNSCRNCVRLRLLAIAAPP